MPIYKYRCEACGDLTEVLAKISDPAPECCSKCGEGPMIKAVARAAFRLSGGGWYAQGYDGASNQSNDSTSVGSSTSSGGSDSSDSGSSSTSSDSSGSSGSSGSSTDTAGGSTTSNGD